MKQKRWFGAGECAVSMHIFLTADTFGKSGGGGGGGNFLNSDLD